MKKERIKAEIKSLINKLKNDKKRYGFIDDGRGDRYIIGQLYLEIEDFNGLMEYYKWFYKNFPDDIGFPELQICWIIGGIQTNNFSIASKHLVELEDVNLYVIPKLLDIEYVIRDVWEGMNISSEEYAEYIKNDYQKFVDSKVQEKLLLHTQSDIYQENKRQLVENYKKLNHTPRGIERSRIIEENSKLLKKWEIELNQNML